MKTHICIKTATSTALDLVPKILKGDYATLRADRNHKGSDYYLFEEDLEANYLTELFLPLPPSQIVYVAVNEEIREKTKETLEAVN